MANWTPTSKRVRRAHEQIIDTINLGHGALADWDSESTDKAHTVIEEFQAYMQAHKDERSQH